MILIISNEEKIEKCALQCVICKTQEGRLGIQPFEKDGIINSFVVVCDKCKSQVQNAEIKIIKVS